MKQIILSIFLISSLFTTQSSQKFVKIEKQPKYTYEQGLSLSLDISACLMDDEGIKKLLNEVLDRFEEETGSSDLIMLFLVLEISQEYKVDLERKFLPDGYKKIINPVALKCRGVVESKHLKN